MKQLFRVGHEQMETDGWKDRRMDKRTNGWNEAINMSGRNQYNLICFTSKCPKIMGRYEIDLSHT